MGLGAPRWSSESACGPNRKDGSGARKVALEALLTAHPRHESHRLEGRVVEQEQAGLTAKGRTEVFHFLSPKVEACFIADLN